MTAQQLVGYGILALVFIYVAWEARRMYRHHKEMERMRKLSEALGRADKARRDQRAVDAVNDLRSRW